MKNTQLNSDYLKEMASCELIAKETSQDIKKKKFKIGHCSRCNSTNLSVMGNRVICNDCNDWQWLEDAIDSCWNGFIM